MLSEAFWTRIYLRRSSMIIPDYIGEANVRPITNGLNGAGRDGHLSWMHSLTLHHHYHHHHLQPPPPPSTPSPPPLTTTTTSFNHHHHHLLQPPPPPPSTTTTTTFSHNHHLQPCASFYLLVAAVWCIFVFMFTLPLQSSQILSSATPTFTYEWNKEVIWFKDFY